MARRASTGVSVDVPDRAGAAKHNVSANIERGSRTGYCAPAQSYAGRSTTFERGARCGLDGVGSVGMGLCRRRICSRALFLLLLSDLSARVPGSVRTSEICGTVSSASQTSADRRPAGAHLSRSDTMMDCLRGATGCCAQCIKGTTWAGSVVHLHTTIALRTDNRCYLHYAEHADVLLYTLHPQGAFPRKTLVDARPPARPLGEGRHRHRR